KIAALSDNTDGSGRPADRDQPNPRPRERQDVNVNVIGRVGRTVIDVFKPVVHGKLIEQWIVPLELQLRTQNGASSGSVHDQSAGQKAFRAVLFDANARHETVGAKF